MKTFDYITAWHQAAKPAYESLPQNLRDLLDRTARSAGHLPQLPDCSMPWPDPENDPQASDVSGIDGFREAFRKVPAEYLALAARVINSIGHWYPSSANGYDVPGRSTGSHWRFSHYADQELRERLGLPARGDGGRKSSGFTTQVHEGAIRVCYEDNDCWIWEEVAPATEAGRTAARAIIARLSQSPQEDRYSAFETLRKEGSGAWPDSWLPFVDHRFLIEEGEMKAREAARPAVLAKTRADLLQATARSIAKLNRECEGMLWFLDHGIGIDNCIYYGHTGIFTFGWRAPVPPAVVSQILDVISEFPYSYAIKCADGRTLANTPEVVTA